MIIKYLRPTGLEEAIRMLSMAGVKSKPLGGGTVLSKKALHEVFTVVDLQKSGLNKVLARGEALIIGAACTLQQLMDYDQVSNSLKPAIERETNLHMRNMATIGGTVISADGCSPLVTALTALDTIVTWQPGQKEVRLADWLADRRISAPGLLIEHIAISTIKDLKCKFLARSPQDYPLASLAVAKGPDDSLCVVAGMVREGHPVVLYSGKSTDDCINATIAGCNSLLTGSRYEEYLKSVLPATVSQMLQESY